MEGFNGSSLVSIGIAMSVNPKSYLYKYLSSNTYSASDWELPISWTTIRIACLPYIMLLFLVVFHCHKLRDDGRGWFASHTRLLRPISTVTAVERGKSLVRRPLNTRATLKSILKWHIDTLTFFRRMKKQINLLLLPRGREWRQLTRALKTVLKSLHII